MEINGIKFRSIIEPSFGSSVYLSLSNDDAKVLTVKEGTILPKRRIQRRLGEKLPFQSKSNSKLKRIIKVTPKERTEPIPVNKSIKKHKK